MEYLSSLQTSSTNPHLSVGLLSADILRLGEQIDTLEQCNVMFAHFDVMDGHFAPPLTIGPTFIAGVKTAMLKDVHLMIDEPLPKLAEYGAAGADIITVHVEACRHPHRTLQAIGELTNKNDDTRSIACGIAINPSTSIDTLEPLLEMADLVMLVAINPGFSGQKFLASTARRIERLRTLMAQNGQTVAIGIDGGVTKANIGEIAALKPDIIVTGSAVFEDNKIRENLENMRAGMQAENRVQ